MKFKRFSVLLITTAMFLAGCGGTEPDPGQHAHVWGDPTYLWAGDYSTCTATSICTLDSTHELKEESRASYQVITPATETAEGLARYTATFTDSHFTTQTKDVVIPTIGVVDSLESAFNSVNTKHNYSAHLNNQWANERDPFADFNYFNIDDNVMFDDFSTYFYSGYIKQKGQGIVNFQLNKTATTTSGLVLGNFVATNLERSISDIYSLAVEHLVDKQFTYDSSLGLYKSTSMDAMAVLANLAFGDYTSLVSAPEYITAKFENNVLTFRGVFDINYFDEVEVHTTGDVTLVVSNFEKTHNALLESYVASPDYTFVAPTEWDSDTIELFKQEFNNVIPPFIEGLSYAWKSGQSVSEGFYVAMVEDYFGGNLIPNYRTALEGEGFRKVENPGLIEYQKVVEDENLIHTYSVKMKYYAPTDTDTNHMQYGYLYPNGVTSIKFLHKQKTKQTIVTVKLLNEYISKTVAGDYLPQFDLADDTKVANFNDASDTSDVMVLLLKGTADASDGAYFRIYADTKEHAIAAVEKYVADLKLLGFDGSSSAGFKQYWMSDEYFSQIKITDPSYAESWSSTTYLQVRIEITQETLNHWKDEPVTLDSISVSGQTTEYTVGDTFRFDGTVTAHYSDGTNEVVTPTSVTAPDMSQAGSQSVVVSYTNDKGETVGTDYLIEVKASTVKYNINVIQVPGATINITLPSDGSLQREAGKSVQFKVNLDDGSTLNGVSVTWSGGNVDVSGPQIMTKTYQFLMPAGDVTVTADVSTSSITKHTISYNVWDTEFNSLKYSDVIDSSSILPTSAAENSTVNFTVVTKSGYTFAYAVETKDDDTVLTTSTFSYPMGTDDLEINIVVSIDPVIPPEVTLSSIRVSGQTTTYEVGDTFSFDGTVTASYSDGSSKTVTPTSVSSPDMSSIGTKTITVSYTEDDKTVAATYTITVSEKQGGGGDTTEFGGTYSWYKGKMGGVDTYFRITFNEDGTGTYVRDPYNGSTATIYFSYVVKGSSIVMTLTDIGDGFNCFSTYRPFSFDTVGTTNSTGVINSDGSVSLTLYNMAGSDGTAKPSGTQTFAK